MHMKQTLNIRTQERAAKKKAPAILSGYQVYM